MRYVAEYAPVSVGEVVEGYGTPRGLSRSTINTTIERLYKKGYLTRARREGVFRYSPAVVEEELLGGLVQRFVEKTLAGSLAPFFTYFVRTGKLSDEQLEELQRLVTQLRTQREEKRE